jgi:hypothetical protein
MLSRDRGAKSTLNRRVLRGIILVNEFNFLRSFLKANSQARPWPLRHNIGFDGAFSESVIVGQERIAEGCLQAAKHLL